jgi:hypothetical protein
MAAYNEYRGTFQEANRNYMKNLLYIPPEALVCLEGSRNPVALLAKMAVKVCQVAPEAEQSRLVAQLASLAVMAAQTPSHMLLSHWWAPMCSVYLPELIGINDTPWKQALIDIWTDSSELKDDNNVPE